MRQENPIVMQGRVLFALIMREMTTRYGRNAGGYIWAVLEPAGTVAMLSLVFEFIARNPALGSSFPFFFATGYMAFHFYLDISRVVGNAVTANRALLTFPRVTIIDAVMARLFIQFLTSLFVTIVILFLLLVFFEEPVIIQAKSIIYSILLAAFLGLGMGLFNSITFNYSATWQSFFNIINRPLFLISGILFLYDSMPRAAQDILWWNPLIHITALMRAGFYPTYSPSFVSTTYVIMFATVPFLLGIMLMRTMREQLLER